MSRSLRPCLDRNPGNALDDGEGPWGYGPVPFEGLYARCPDDPTQAKSDDHGVVREANDREEFGYEVDALDEMDDDGDIAAERGSTRCRSFAALSSRDVPRRP